MSAAAASIREAIVREQYQNAMVRWNEYARCLRHAIESGVATTEQMSDARSLLEWSRPMLLGAREQLRARYHDLEVASAYTARPPARRGLLETRL